MATTRRDQGIQTLTPIPYEEGQVYANIDCYKCGRLWIPYCTEIILYDFYGTRLCFDCANERDQAKFLWDTEDINFMNAKAWLPIKVKISDFDCCNCGKSCDVNYKVTDGFIGKIPFYIYLGSRRHRFCIHCFELVKLDVHRLNPQNCRHLHTTSDEDSD